jgi:butyryl-CoA dehydrogenase
MMTTDMNPRQLALVQSATAFASDHLEPVAAAIDHAGMYPKAIIAEAAAHEFLGLLLPETWGGSESGFAAHIEVVEALSRACPAVAAIVNNHALAARAIAQWGDEDQKRRYLPALGKGAKLAAFAIMETGAGPGLGPDALIASRQGSGFSLTGMKAFVRNAGAADVYVVFASRGPAADKDGMTAFIVDAATAGMTIGPRLETMGLNGCPVAHLLFHEASVHEDAVLHAEGAGAAIAEQLLSLYAVAEAALSAGIGQAAVTHAAEYAGQRKQFHHPIAHQQAVQTMLAEAATDRHIGWLGVQRAARLVDDGVPFEVEAAMVKAFFARFGTRMLIDSCQVEGGLGISEEAPKGIREALPLARLFRDMAGTTLLDAPDDFPDMLIAARLT